MNQSMINAAVTMGQIQQKLDTVSNNLANANTTGFKRRDTSFSDLLFQQVNNQRVGPYEEGRQTPGGIRTGSGAATAQTAMRFEQGSLQQTDRPLDVALTQPGYFFEISPDEDGTRRFTRDGAFYLSPNPADEMENFLVNSEGEYVLNTNEEPLVIPFPAQDLRISETGAVFYTAENGEEIAVDQLNAINITKPQLLANTGGNNFVFPDLEALDLVEADVMEQAGGAEVFQAGSLEMANVDTAKQMSDMLAAQRFYQFNSSAINMTDQMMGMVTNLR
ncbi:flagellar hook-basal body protein [Alkalicoccus daliensis]|uniref:Flagellar basal-body rod protein FlgG n=1 Tax=Alkalicoccus daliensis TaxID=745820 RepID=A0A1H0GKB3_9BACI|nr:flagellar hook-basal body protein [Alkalicoccus daliensis]SDO07397.1 flagellar basal-body rod protein FlgG [Alkalicoccus daliensis]